MSEETKNTTNVTTDTTKKTTWVNRIWSAVIGAAVAVASMFGITSEQIAEEKAKVTSVQSQVKVALEALKSGDVTTATANLQAAVATGKEVIADAKTIADKVKNTDKESIIETAKDQLTKTVVKEQVKKVENATAAYADDITKKVNTTEIK